MKAEIQKDGTLRITAESATEAYALNMIAKFDKNDNPEAPSYIVIDCGIILAKEE